MRRRAALAAILAGWACLAGASELPRLVCDPAWDVGAIPNNVKLARVMLLRNAGGAPLVIRRVRVCCGVAASLSTNVVPPGGMASLRLELDPAGRTGPLRKSVYLVSNDPAAPYFQLHLTGATTAELEAVPDRIDFGNIDETGAVERVIRVASATGAPFRVTRVTASVSWVACRWEPEAGGTGGVLRVRTVPPLPSGALAGRVALTTDRPSYPRLELTVGARVDSEVVVVPASIGLSREGDAVRYLAIRRRGGQPFKLLDVELPRSGMKAEVSALGPDGYRVAVSGIGKPAGLEGRFLTLHTDLDGMEEIAVPFRSTVRIP